MGFAENEKPKSVQENETKELEELMALLKKHNINFGEWEGKTVNDLANEIRKGESWLVEEKIDGKNELVREIQGVGVDVYYADENGKRFILREKKQVFKSGEELIRGIGTSIGEKKSVGEDSKSAVQRALKEELGFNDDEVEHISLSHLSHIKKDPIISQSFPGLLSRYMLDIFSCTISKDLYNPKGYVERRADRDIYFVWEEVVDK